MFFCGQIWASPNFGTVAISTPYFHASRVDCNGFYFMASKTHYLLKHHQHWFCRRYNVNGFVEELPRLPENRWDHACAALPSTKVRLAKLMIWLFQAFIVAGGNDGYERLSSVLTLLPGASLWTPLASLPRSLSSALVSIVGGKMRLTGGFDGSSWRSEVVTLFGWRDGLAIGWLIMINWSSLLARCWNINQTTSGPLSDN